MKNRHQINNEFNLYLIDGMITEDKFKAALHKSNLRLTMKEIDRALAICPRAQGGKIYYQEFVVIMNVKFSVIFILI